MENRRARRKRKTAKLKGKRRRSQNIIIRIKQAVFKRKEGIVYKFGLLCVLSRRAQSWVCIKCVDFAHLTLIMGAETTVTVVVVSHEMQSKPVLIADDRRRDITARQPEIKT